MSCPVEFTRDLSALARWQVMLSGGRNSWNKIAPTGFQKALECYGRALAIDPRYAPAYAGIAQSYIIPGQLGMVEPRPFLLKARAAAERALALDPDLAEAHAMTLGRIRAQEGVQIS